MRTARQISFFPLGLLILLIFIHSSHQTRMSNALAWQPLPHIPQMERRGVLAGGASLATAAVAGAVRPPISSAAEISSDAWPAPDSGTADRSVSSVDSHPVIPVWPTWGGGRVVPVSLGSPLHDPYLLLAHHKHWFDPRDPLRGPFKAVGKALGLPYVDVEGFSMHPHRGFDILTYVLDGSDGFRHRDSLGGKRTYRGGSAQWMRTGSGVLHEEFWETRPDRRTDVELFQIWINLPASMKFDEPAVRYVGTGTNDPWLQQGKDDAAGSVKLDRAQAPGSVSTRDVGSTLDRAVARAGGANDRPPVEILHSRIAPGAEWKVRAPRGHSAVLYVREGVASLAGGKQQPESTVKALQTATFAPDGDIITVGNSQRGVSKANTLDVLLLMAEPLRETVALGGPIVMNTESELNDAYRQLQDGSFLDRKNALRQQAKTSRRSS